jgi:hypothetical protein
MIVSFIIQLKSLRKYSNALRKDIQRENTFMGNREQEKVIP